jgi:hypothetical protein
VLPALDEDWQALYPALDVATALNSQTERPDSTTDLNMAWAALVALRDIVATSLAVANNWSEYYIALALCALRAVCQAELGIRERRFMFLLSALAVAQLDQHHDIDRDSES